MNQNQVIENTAKYLKQELSRDSSGHDWWHTYRVWKMAVKIAENEDSTDLFVVQLAALLHDIADWKLNKGDESIGPKKARKWLEKLQVDENIISHVCQIIKDVSFKGAKVKSKMKTLEGKIVQDADKLDAIGAIGIARCFTYGGNNKREMYNPKIKPELHKSFEEFKKSALGEKKNTSINHFYEKLLLLKDRMNTKTAKKIAKGRHEFTEKYLNQFLKEWEGKL